MIGRRKAFSAPDGTYKLSELPPGQYIVTFYLDTVAVKRTGVTVGVQKATPVYQEVPLVDFTEPPVPEPPKRPVKVANEPRVHDVVAPVEQTAQVAGKDPVTQTPNPKALFKMNKGGADEPDNAGNPRAPQGEDKASGDGPGLNPDGLDQLDQGLQGRGLVGNLPKPSYPGSKSGKVVIRVTVDAKGKVTGASYEPKGSTTDAAELVGAAKSAALKARFTESRATLQGGTITYVFRME